MSGAGNAAMFLEQSLICNCIASFFVSPDTWRRDGRVLGAQCSIRPEQYDMLLKGTCADVKIPLWASLALKKGASLKDETTLEVIKSYAAYGYRPQTTDGNPPDEIGSMFLFLRYLYACAQTDARYADAAKVFEDRFVIETCRAFREAYRRHLDLAAAEDVDVLLSCMEAFFLHEENGIGLQKQYAEPALKEIRAIRPLPPYDVEEPHIINSAGINNCGGKCKINITVAADCALQITTDESDNDPQIRACVRGRGYRRTFLSGERLRYPMRRTGARGEGRFERISWEEATKAIADKIISCGRTCGPASRYFIYGTGNCAVMRADHMLKRLLNMDGGFLGRYNSYSTGCSTFTAPFIFGDAFPGNSERDMLSSRLIILWGHNPAETVFGSLRNFYLAEAKAKGIPMVVIDPRRNDTAYALAEEWIPLRPTTDGALADAMAYVIVKKNLHDREFLRRFCVGFDGASLPEGVPETESYLAYLTGAQDGVEKTPAWGEKITGVPAEVIERLAVRYATTKPACILTGMGPQRNGNGEQITRCIAALSCLTGNVGIPGGGTGVTGFHPNREPVEFPQMEAYPGKIPAFLWTKAIEEGTSMTPGEDGIQGTDRLDSNIKLLFCIASNTLINQHSDINRTKRILEDTSKCEMIVVSDLFMTPSARYADILLPAASLLESNNITMPWANDDYLLSNSRAVQPLFGALPDYEWVSMIAKHMGMYEAFSEGHDTTEAWLSDLYETYRKEVAPSLPDYEIFRERGGFQYRNEAVKIAYREQIEKGIPFQTPSGKIELFSKRLYDMGQPDRIPAIPKHVEPPEGPFDERRKRYPLQLIGYHTKRRCHSIHDRNIWMEELESPSLWIHPSDAKEREIRDGAMVEVYNDRGRVRIAARVTDRIMRGVTAMSQGAWYTPDKDGTDVRGSINVLTDASRPTPLSKGNPQHTNLVEVVAVRT